MVYLPTIGISLIIAISFAILIEAIRIITLSKRAVKAGKKISPASQEVTNPILKILVLGDSTSLGTGTSSAGQSLVGRLVNDFPKHTIINESENALTLTKAKNKLQQMKNCQFDVAIIHLGGMDTITFTPLKKVKKELTDIFEYLKLMGVETTIIVSVNNSGAVPFFRFPLNHLYTHRSRCISKQCAEVAKAHSVIHVPLFTETNKDPLYENGVWQVAKDKCHPNDRGYEIWYKKIYPIISPYLNKQPK